MSTTWLAVDRNSYSHIVLGQNSYLHIVMEENSYYHNYVFIVDSMHRKKLKIYLINLQYTEPRLVWKTGVRGITGYF